MEPIGRPGGLRPEEALRRGEAAAAKPGEAVTPPSPSAAPTPVDGDMTGDQAKALPPRELRGRVPMPVQPTGATAADYDGFVGFEAYARRAGPGGMPVGLDAAARDRFIGAELDRLGLVEPQRGRKQARMLTLFRRADLDGDGVVGTPQERQALVKGLIAGSQADAIAQQLQARAAEQAQAVEAASQAATGGNFVARGFNSFLNVFNHNMDEMDEARRNAVKLLRNDLPADLERYNDMVAEAGGDEAGLAKAQAFLEGALARSAAAGKEFDQRLGDLQGSNKFWSGLAADVGSGLLVLGGAALCITGFGAPIGAGMIAGGFAAGGAASVGLHALLDNQYDFKKEALGNFVVGGISAAATIATAGASAGVTSGIAGTLGRQASNQAVMAGLTTFAQEGANGFQDGWMLRLAIGTATGAALGKASSALAGGLGNRLGTALGEGVVAQKAAQVISGAAAGGLGSGGAAAVNETIEALKAGGFKEGAADRVLQQTLGGTLAGGIQALGPDLAKAAEANRKATHAERQAAEQARLAEVEKLATAGDAELRQALKAVTDAEPFRERVAAAREAYMEALGHSPDGDVGWYARRAEGDLNHGLDPKLVAHIDEGARTVSRDVPADVRRPEGRIVDQADMRRFDETFERLLATNPEAMRKLHAASYEAVGINPKAVEQLVYDYTHTSNTYNPKIKEAIAESAQRFLKEPHAQPRPDSVYDPLIKAMLDTRPLRAQFMSEVTGMPVADAYRVYRGTDSKGTVDRIAGSWFRGEDALKINNWGVTSATLDPRAAIDFGAKGGRSVTVQASKEVKPFVPAEKTYVAYDLDVDARFVLFDKYTDGGFSVDGTLQQRAQNEVLITSPEAALLTDPRRATITYKGETYTYERREALRQAMAGDPDFAKALAPATPR